MGVGLILRIAVPVAAVIIICVSLWMLSMETKRLKASLLVCETTRVTDAFEADRMAIELELDALRQRMAEMTLLAERQERILVATRERTAELESDKRELTQQRDEARNTEVGYADWADTPVPDGVRDRLRQSAGGARRDSTGPLRGGQN